MPDLSAFTRTGRVQLGPGSDLVELQGKDGARFTSIAFHPEYRSHNAINAALHVVLGFLESPMVDGLSELSTYDLSESVFVYKTGTTWSVAEIVRTISDMGESAGVRAGMELLARVGQILVEAAEAGESAAVYSHGGLTPWRVVVDAEGRAHVIGHALPQVEVLTFHADPTRVPREDAFRYCPPERMEARKENFSSDLFGLGLIAFELMSGRPVYDGLVDEIRTQASRGETSRRLHQHRELLPDPVRELLTTALRPDFRDRFPSGEAFLASADMALRDRRVTGPSLRDVMQRIARTPTRVGQDLDPAKTSMLSREALRKLIDDEDSTPQSPRRETASIPARPAHPPAPAAAPLASAPPDRTRPPASASPAPPPPPESLGAARPVPGARPNPRLGQSMDRPALAAAETPVVAPPPGPVTVSPPPQRAMATPPAAPAAYGDPTQSASRPAMGARGNPRVAPRQRAEGEPAPDPSLETLDRILRTSTASAPPAPPPFDPTPMFNEGPVASHAPVAPPPLPVAPPPAPVPAPAPVAPPPLPVAPPPAPVPAPAPPAPPPLPVAPPPAPVPAPAPPAPPPLPVASPPAPVPAPAPPAPPATFSAPTAPVVRAPAAPVPPPTTSGPRFLAPLADDDDDGAATAAFVRPVRGAVPEGPPAVIAPTAPSAAPAAPPPAAAPVPDDVTRSATAAGPSSASGPVPEALASTMRGDPVPFRLVRGPGVPAQKRKLPGGSTLAEVVALLLGQALPLPLAADGRVAGWYRLGPASGPLPADTRLETLGADPVLHLHRVEARLVRVRVTARAPEGLRSIVTDVSTAVPASSLAAALAGMFELAGDWQIRAGDAVLGPFHVLADVRDEAQRALSLERA